MSDAQQNYTPEEHAAAWAAYYAQQGYDAAAIAAMTNGYSAVGASSAGPSTSAAGPASHGGAAGSYATPGYDANGYRIQTNNAPPLLDADMIEQSSVYVPGGETKAPQGKGKLVHRTGKRQTVIRKAGGRTWEDPTLLDWDPKWYRLFVGDVSNDVSERTLDEAFNKYRTYCKCKVVRDHLSQKAKYAFIAFKDPEDFLKAWKEMDGKYVGNRPIRLSKVKDEKYGTIETTTVSGRKAKELDKLRRNRGKPLNGRPVAF